MKNAPSADYLPTWLQRILASVLGVIFLLLPFHAFLSTWGGTGIGPLLAWKSWKEVVLLLVTIPVIWWLCARPARWKQLTREPLLWWVLAFVAILLWLGLLHASDNGYEATLAGIAMDGRYLLGFGLSYVLFRWGRWQRPDWNQLRHYIGRHMLVLAAILVGLGLIQILLLPNDFLSHFGYDKATTIAPYVLIDDNPAAPRAFATLRGPNDFGAFLILPLILALVAARRTRWMLGLTAFVGIGLYASGSRSAWIGAVVAVSSLLAISLGRRVLKDRKIIVASLAALVVIAGLIIGALSLPSLRLALFHSSPGDSSLTEGSTDNHWRATAAGLLRVLQHPLGCGPGCAGPASYYGTHPQISENYYVQIAEETGIAGLILWIGIAVMMAQRLWRHRSDWLARALLASFIGISVIGLWLHVWTDDPLSLTWWLLAGAVLGTYDHPLYDKQKAFTPKHDRKKQKNPAQIRH